jgi:hypothetical protein
LPRVVATLVAPIENLQQGLACASQLSRLCLVGSAILLCHNCKIPGVTAPYALVYTTEGLQEDVAVEIAQARETLNAECVSGIFEHSSSGSELWAKWLGDAPPTETTMRAGVAPKDLGTVLVDVVDKLGDASFIADIGNGLLYVRGFDNGQSVQQAACQVGGYAVVLNVPTQTGEFDMWGYEPGSLDLMRKLKAQWDPRGILNPNRFLI